MMDVSRETMEQLRSFEALLVKWNRKINLVAATEDLWGRHILDSLQIWKEVPQGIKRHVDFGSGGGLPAIVLSIVAAERLPGLKTTMIESDARKSAFLRTCIREFGLNAEVMTARVEATNKQNADLITARATANLAKLLEWSMIHGNQNTMMIFPKGDKHQLEIDEALLNWSFDVEKVESQTHGSGRILKIKNLRKAEV